MSDSGMTPEEIAELRADRDRLQQERDAAIRQATEESRRADGMHVTSARREAETALATLAAQEQAAEATITAATQELTALKRDHSLLLAEGKFEEASELQEKIGDATARRQQATQAKGYFGNQREQVAKQPVDPVDRFFAVNTNFSDAEKNWIRQNPRYATDQTFRERVNRAHAEAEAAGVQPQTPDYFSRLESAGYQRPAPTAQRQPIPRGTEELGGSSAGEPGGEGDNPYSGAADADPVLVEEPVDNRPRPQPARSVAAAPSRRPPTTPRQSQGGTIQLTAEQAGAALAMSDYAPPEVLEQGEAGIYKWWAQLNSSPMANRLRADWAGRAE